MIELRVRLCPRCKRTLKIKLEVYDDILISILDTEGCHRGYTTKGDSNKSVICTTPLRFKRQDVIGMCSQYLQVRSFKKFIL